MKIKYILTIYNNYLTIENKKIKPKNVILIFMSIRELIINNISHIRIWCDWSINKNYSIFVVKYLQFATIDQVNLDCDVIKYQYSCTSFQTIIELTINKLLSSKRKNT